MARSKEDVAPLPLGSAQEGELDPSTYLTVYQSNVVGTALKRSKARWLAPPPTYGSAPFTTLLTRFSSTSKARNVAVVRNSPHRLHEIGSCDLVIGPHTFPSTRFFYVVWLDKMPPPQPRPVAPPQARPPTSKPASAAPKPKPIPPPPRPQQTAVPGTYVVTPALIAALNAAARQDATLAAHLSAAGKGTASAETLQALGKYIRAVQSQISSQESGRKSASPAAAATQGPPRPGPSTLPPSRPPPPGPSRPHPLPQSRPNPPRPVASPLPAAPAAFAPVTLAQAAPASVAPVPQPTPTSQPPAPSSSAPSAQNSTAPRPSDQAESDPLRLRGGSGRDDIPTLSLLGPSNPAVPSTTGPAPPTAPIVARPAPIQAPSPSVPVPAAPASPEGAGRVRKPTLKKLEAEEGEQAYSSVSHRPVHAPSSTHPPAPPIPRVQGSGGGLWPGPGKAAIVIEFRELDTERWLIPPWAMLEKVMVDGKEDKVKELTLSFFGPPERVGQLPKSAFRPPQKDPPKPPAPSTGSAVPPATAPVSEPGPTPVDTAAALTSAATLASTSPAPPATDPSVPTPAPTEVPPRPASPPLRPPRAPLHPILFRLPNPSLHLVKALTVVSNGIGWSDAERGEWFERQWDLGGCSRSAKEGEEVEVLQWRLPKNVSGPLAELVQGVDVAAPRAVLAKGAKRKADDPVALGGDLFAVPVPVKRKRPGATSIRGKRASGQGGARATGRKSGGVATPLEEGSATPVPSGEAGSTRSPSVVATSQPGAQVPSTSRPSSALASAPIQTSPQQQPPETVTPSVVPQPTAPGISTATPQTIDLESRPMAIDPVSVASTAPVPQPPQQSSGAPPPSNDVPVVQQ